MCGISGLANFDNPVSLAGYYSAHLRLRHRGRDDEGFWAIRGDTSQFFGGDDTNPIIKKSLPHIKTAKAANVVLGHRRLSIIDLSPGGHQPMSDSSGRYTITYNGEIFNYLELRNELQLLGHNFIGDSDTEVFLAALNQWGTDSFTRLNGMWAAAIYDHQKQQLILTRDRFGIKPLYYVIANNTLFFASETKFLHSFVTSLQMNERRVMEYIARSLTDHHAETVFEGIYQIRPAHYATFNSFGLHHQCYWQPPSQENQLTLDSAIEQLSSLLTSSIKLRLRSDVPIGSLLSGGLDSTTIVCLVHQLLGQQHPDNSFDFFSAVFKEEAFSERKYIEDTVAQTNMPIHWIYPNPDELTEKIPKLLYHQEFPFRSLAVYSQWEIMRSVAQTPIKVLLNGQGSDEIFGGYTAHYNALIAEYARRLRLGRAWQEVRSFSRSRNISLMQVLVLSLWELVKTSPFNRLANQRPVAYFNRGYRPVHTAPQQADVFREALIRNLTFSALPEYLRYEDRNSMAFTLESRLPFMDYRLVEWAMSLPAELKIKGTSSKRVLREMARPIIPDSVSTRTDKMGFVSPQEEWQRHTLKPMLDSVFNQDLQAIFPFLDGTRVQSMYRQYQAGHNNNWALMWRIANLTWWYQYWWT